MVRIATIEGDASTLTGRIMIGTVFFLYCPFSGRRLEHVVDELEPIAATRPLRICSVDLQLPERRWLVCEPQLRDDLAIYRTTRHDEAFASCTARNQQSLARAGAEWP